MRSLLAGLVAAVFIAPSALAVAESPQEIKAPVDKIFIPNGFDDNDNVEVVLHGDFPNTCYHVGHVSAKVDHNARIVTVNATAYVYDAETMCAEVITPFIQSVKLGVLRAGNYTVRVDGNADLEMALEVNRRTTESPEDHLYAPVENAKISIDAKSGKQALLLEGHFPYMFIGCMKMREVRMRRDPSDVLIVQPIAEIVNDETCRDQPTDHSFSIVQGLQQPFLEEGLLHVRVLNGDAINRLVMPRP